MWGGNLTNFGQKEKNPCVLFPCFYFQPLSLKNYCWWLRQLIALGVRWQDYQSSPPRTLYPRFWLFISSRRYSSTLHELLSTQERQIRVLPVVCASTDKNRAAFPHAGPPLSVPFFAGSDCLPTHRYSSVWGAHSELRAVLLHPRLTVKGHSRFWLSHRLFGSFFPAVRGAH